MKKTFYKTNQNNPIVKAYISAVKKGNESQHVVFHGQKWAVKKAGSVRASKIFSTQKAATKYANSVAKSEKSSVFIHKKDGRIKSRKDY